LQYKRFIKLREVLGHLNKVKLKNSKETYFFSIKMSAQGTVIRADHRTLIKKNMSSFLEGTLNLNKKTVFLDLVCL
jgi:hypothetical protein